MKIALVRPNHRCLSNTIMPPLGIGYLSSYLKSHGIETVVVDALRDRLNEASTLDIVLKRKPDVVGITCYTAYYSEAVALSKGIKKNNIPCIIGGPHPTFLTYETLLDSKADFAICGEAEIAITALLKNNLINNNIKGVYSLDNLSSPDLPVVKAEIVEDLDLVPFPDWESMPPDSYPEAPHGFFNRDYPVGIIMTTRGCPYSCVFCCSPKFYEQRLRYRSAQNVIQEIKYLYENFKVREIHFFDDNFTFKREHAEQICQLIIDSKLKISWSLPTGIRADKVDEELLRLMKRSGCYYLQLGIESANPQILRNIKKAETIGRIRKTIKLCDKVSLYTSGSFIFGLPGETKDTIKETIKFATSVPLTKADFPLLDVLPGSELWDTLKGRFTPNWSKLSLKEPEFIPEGLSKAELLTAQTTAFRKFYFRPIIFLRVLGALRPSYIKFIFKKLFEYRIIKNNNRKINNLGWQPRVNLKEGIRKTYEFYSE